MQESHVKPMASYQGDHTKLTVAASSNSSNGCLGMVWACLCKHSSTCICGAMQSASGEVQDCFSHAASLPEKPEWRHITSFTQMPMPSGASDEPAKLPDALSSQCGSKNKAQLKG